jgi:hypothetical protein
VHGATQSLAAVDDGFRAALIVAAAIAAAGSVVAAFVLPGRKLGRGKLEPAVATSAR